MKFKVVKYIHQDYYFIQLGYWDKDMEISWKLNLKFGEYVKILMSCNARLCGSQLKFEKEQDAQRAITKLDPYLILVILTEDEQWS